MKHAQFILASGSPRRRELLDRMGMQYVVSQAEVSEIAHPGETPEDYVNRIALEKASWVADRMESGLPVLAADTAVVLDGEILGKPAGPEDARQMLLRLSGRTHEVLTSVVLLSPDGVAHRRLNVSRVTFANLDTDWIGAYCGSREPLDKAGSYAIQGFAGQWVVRLDGSYTGVMGLPLSETMELLRQAGIPAMPTD